MITNIMWFYVVSLVGTRAATITTGMLGDDEHYVVLCGFSDRGLGTQNKYRHAG